LPLIEHVAKKNKPLIISTGMSKISEIDEAVETVRSTGNKNLIFYIVILLIHLLIQK
jgi:sialic acid synthase SpsE